MADAAVLLQQIKYEPLSTVTPFFFPAIDTVASLVPPETTLSAVAPRNLIEQSSRSPDYRPSLSFTYRQNSFPLLLSLPDNTARLLPTTHCSNYVVTREGCDFY